MNWIEKGRTEMPHGKPFVPGKIRQERLEWPNYEIPKYQTDKQIMNQKNCLKDLIL